MENQIELSIENGIGIITLNRPEAINALTPYMIETIHKTLLDWISDDGVRAILIEGKGERGFCAGGDVRWTRDMILKGNHKCAFEFFALEYEMNHLIATYNKPIIALTHGVVMGGGLGIAGHAKYRITTQNSRFAMPEAAIGYFCDVGVRAILAKGARHRAMMFMLSGSLVSAVDGVVLGLTDTIIPEEGVASARAAIIRTGSAEDVDAQISSLCTALGNSDEFVSFCKLADKFDDVFNSEDPAEIYSNLEKQVSQKSELAEVATLILSRCPTSNMVHVLGLDAARETPEIGQVLAADLRLAHFMAVRDDFVEGVRAVLIDKDHAPNWSPDRMGDVAGEKVVLALKPRAN